MYAIILFLALQAQISFAANGLPCNGNVCASYYEDIAGNHVSSLKNAAKFPSSPDNVITLNDLDVPKYPDVHCVQANGGKFVNECVREMFAANPNANICGPCGCSGCPLNKDASKDNYGVMVQAWVKAPETGDYVFSTFSDDSSEVWISTVAGEKRAEADMVKVVELNGCCVKVTGTTMVSLEKGKSYYLLAYMKEGIGRDYITIGMTDRTHNVEYYPVTQEHLGFVASTMYTKQEQDKFCWTGLGEKWLENRDSIADCQRLCNLDSTCVALSWWDENNMCMLASVCDKFHDSHSGAVTYFKVEGAVAPQGTPVVEGCTNGDSEFTQKMLGKMDVAQEQFGECDSDVRSISTTLGRLGLVSGAVETATETLSTIISKVNSVTDKVMKTPPGIGNILGKIPKVGIFIKMGLKVVEKVIDSLDPLAKTVANHAERIDSAVKMSSKLFTGLKTASTPTSLYLKGSHKILESAHSCGMATGYQCGTAAAAMEARNEGDYPDAEDRLDAIAEVGETCHSILSPVDAMLKQLAKIGEAIMQLLGPLLEILRQVMEFIAEMDRKIEEFVRMLKESEELQCALEIFEPVTDVINLVTCPIDEVAGFVMHNIIDVMRASITQVINTAVILGVNVVVEGIIPDDLYVHIPDFTAIIPVDFWVDTCNVAAGAFPGYATTVGTIMSLDLPKTFSGREIKDEILADAFEGLDLLAMTEDYESACKLAWNEMGVDFENCEKVIEKIAEAVEDATCAAHQASLAVEMELLDTQQGIYNVARDHFEDAQKEFVKAQDALADVYNDLDSAYDSVEAEKANCPKCRCGGCSSADIVCHLEGVWCCPVRHGCLAAMHIAQGGIELAMDTVDAASDIAFAAQKLYSQAAQSLSTEQEKLKHQKTKTEREAVAQALACSEATIAPVTIQTAAPLPPCKCYDEWWSGECGGESVTHFGCPATPCDNDPVGRWCATEPGCAQEESTFDGGWFYCGDVQRDFALVKSGDCLSNGYSYITNRDECITAGRQLGVEWTGATPSGNRQKWCGTFGGLQFLHFNARETGKGANGYPIHQTAGKYSGQDSWQICKRSGNNGRRLELLSTGPKLAHPVISGELQAPVTA